MRRILALGLLVFLSVAAAGASKVELDARVRAAMQALDDVPAGKELARKASGILVFPRVVKGGFGVGGEYGEGALLVNGQTVQYYRVASISVGFQAGGQAKTEVIMFMTDTALRLFRESDGWEAGVDGNIAVFEFGTGREVNTNNLRDPIVGFIYNNKGLMYDLSLAGSKFWKTHKE